MNEQILEKIGETKTDKVIQDCYKIYRESFDKLFPYYFEKNHLKAISFVTVFDKDSTEIKNIGMSCPDDLLTKQFAQVFGGLLGGSDGANPDGVKQTTGAFGIGHTHGGASFDGLGTSFDFARGMILQLGNGFDAITKESFVATNLFLNLLSNFGSFNSGLGQVTWSGTGTILANNTITQTAIQTVWNGNTAGQTKTFILAWDNINPNVSVLLGQNVNVEYKLVFS